MQDGQPSQTALMVSIMRAYHHHFGTEPKIFSDGTALALSGLESPAAAQAMITGMKAQFSGLSDEKTADVFVDRIIEAVCLRARLVQEALRRARENPITQFIVLGAGLDSMCYSLGDTLEGLNLFEVDYPATQVWKRDRLKTSGVAIPPNLKFVPFDFENTTLSDALEAGDVDRSAVTLFSWLGVQMYLTEEAVQATLDVVGSFPKGSEIIMDFIMPDGDIHMQGDGQGNEAAVESLRQVVAGMSEPFKSMYSETVLQASLIQAGFTVVKFHPIKDIIDQYLGGDDRHISTPGSAVYLASAIV